MQEIDLNYYKSWRELDAIEGSGTPYEFVGEGKIVTFEDEEDHQKWLDLMYEYKAEECKAAGKKVEDSEKPREEKSEATEIKSKADLEDILADLII